MAEYNREEEAAQPWVRQLRHDKWAGTPEEQEEWSLVMEWVAVPTVWVKFREPGDTYDRVRIERPCPPEWWDSEDGQEKIRKLCNILGRDAFTLRPRREEE